MPEEIRKVNFNAVFVICNFSERKGSCLCAVCYVNEVEGDFAGKRAV